MVPASNMKVVTTAAAMRYLGADYEYKTRVGMCGETLVVIGCGDPLLGDRKTDSKYRREPNWVFRDIASILRRAGIVRVNDIVIDTSVFDDQRVHPNWPKAELNRWYACEVCGLNFNCNCIEIGINNTNGKVTVLAEPQTAFVEIINEVKPTSSGPSLVGAYRDTQSNRIMVRGRCADTVEPFAVAIERPAAFFGFLLAEQLARNGIEVTGQLAEKALDEKCEMRILAEYTTRLGDCLERANKDSLGLAAEALLKTIAANSNAGAKHGSWEKGRQMISQYLAELGVDSGQFSIDDGSGLSKNNRLSAEAITRVLHNIYKSQSWELYRSCLALGGMDGTLSRYFREQKYRGKVLGKTGYINDAKSFSGVCLCQDRDYIFSILANNTDGQTREAINDIAEAIIDCQSGLDSVETAYMLSPKSGVGAVSD
jgi:D-alanyl-D-alanine carboxypeptidase/D-alanyl-D-alanine-endopeptidase (penicillin-binding protein 4)